MARRNRKVHYCATDFSGPEAGFLYGSLAQKPRERAEAVRPVPQNRLAFPTEITHHVPTSSVFKISSMGVPVSVREFSARNSELFLSAGLAALALYFFSGYFTPVRFDRERIEVRVTSGRIHVKGLYHYANASRLPAVLTLRVPFPVDAEHPQPEWFTLCHSGEDGRMGEEILPMVRGRDVSFRLIFRPQEAKWVRLDYLQPSRVNHGRYLLTTTKPWRRPIGRADYILRLQSDLALVSSNYQVSSVADTAGGSVFVFSKSDFFPDRDWEFAWSDSRAEAAMRTGDLP